VITVSTNNDSIISREIINHCNEQSTMLKQAIFQLPVKEEDIMRVFEVKSFYLQTNNADILEVTNTGVSISI
jgi:hypothetical protein